VFLFRRLFIGLNFTTFFGTSTHNSDQEPRHQTPAGFARLAKAANSWSSRPAMFERRMKYSSGATVVESTIFAPMHR
jgi:hypothetical protein